MGKDMHGMYSPSMHASFIFGDLGHRRGGSRGRWSASQSVHAGRVAVLRWDGGVEVGSWMRRAGWRRRGRGVDRRSTPWDIL